MRVVKIMKDSHAHTHSWIQSKYPGTLMQSMEIFSWRKIKKNINSKILILDRGNKWWATVVSALNMILNDIKYVYDAIANNYTDMFAGDTKIQNKNKNKRNKRTRTIFT